MPSMSKHRIVCINGSFIVQRKYWLFWFNVKRYWNDGECVETFTLPKFEDAIAYISRTEMAPMSITEKMVDAVVPYIDGKLPLEERKQYAHSALTAAIRGA